MSTALHTPIPCLRYSSQSRYLYLSAFVDRHGPPQRSQSHFSRRWLSRGKGVPKQHGFMGTWLVPESSQFTISAFKEQLPVVEPRVHHTNRFALFLLTPSLAHLLEPQHPFLEECMNHVYGKAADVEDEKFPFNLKSVGVVVDAVPAMTLDLHPPYSVCPSPSEGISLLISSLPNVSLAGEQLALKPGTISFQLEHRTPRPPKTEFTTFTSVQIPAANTLFVNGQHHTIRQKMWQLDRESNPKIQPVPESGLPTQETDSSVRVTVTNDTSFVRVNRSPLQPLTEPKLVASSMGNIIRSLYSDDKMTEIPASSEIERAVPEYLRSVEGKVEHGKFEVYALIKPKAEVRTSIDTKDPLVKGIARGGRLHRVTSGGGGWGKKQGLLSLDPAVDFNVQEDVPFEESERGPRHLDHSMPIPEDHDKLEQYQSPSGHLASQGCTIQFFATYYNPTASHTRVDKEKVKRMLRSSAGNVVTDMVDGSEISNPDESLEDQSTSDLDRLTLGTIPARDQPDNHPSVTENVANGVVFLPRKFGMLSEGGMNLSVHKLGANKNAEFLVRSRLDCPYSLIESHNNSRIPTKSSPQIRRYKGDVRRIAEKSAEAGDTAPKQLGYARGSEVQPQLTHARSTRFRKVNTADLDRKVPARHQLMTGWGTKTAPG